MTSTPKSIGDESLSESWMEVGYSSGRVTPVAVSGLNFVNGSPVSSTGYSIGQLTSAIGDEYLRLLKEAQRESNHSSARVSLASSLRGSRCESPKSPPNSPNPESAAEDEELKDIFINKEAEGAKEWLITHWNTCYEKTMKKKVDEKKDAMEPIEAQAERSSLCKDMFYTFLLSNFLSFLLGAGIGLWISRRSAAAITSAPQ